MIKQLKKILQKLSKKISRKNLYKDIDFYVNKIKNQENGLESLKVLNVGSGGQIGDYLKSKFNFFYSIDINKNRCPITSSATSLFASGSINFNLWAQLKIT